MKRRIAAVFSYGFARLLMTLISAIQIGVWCLLAVPSLFSRKVAELMEALVMFQPDPDYEDDSIYLTRHADWPCGETDKTE